MLACTLRGVRIPIRRLAPVALLLLAVLALAACGGGGNDKDAQRLLDTAFNKAVDSADLKLDAQLDLKGLSGFDKPLRLQASGPFRNIDGKIPAADLSLQVGAAGQSIDTGFVSTGDRAFVKFQDVYYEQPPADVARANAAIGKRGKSRGSLKALGLDPRGWLADSQQKGDEEVAGVKTEHVSGTLDVGSVISDFNQLVKRSGSAIGGVAGQPPPNPLTPSDIDRIKQIVKSPSFDVYVGKDDGIIRRLSGRVEFKVPDSDSAKLGGLKGGTLSFSLEFSKVNGNQRIQAPASARPLSDLIKSLGASSLGGLKGGSGSGSGSSPGPGSDAFKKYSDCLDKAKPQNTDALQRCAELLQ